MCLWTVAFKSRLYCWREYNRVYALSRFCHQKKYFAILCRENLLVFLSCSLLAEQGSLPGQDGMYTGTNDIHLLTFGCMWTVIIVNSKWISHNQDVCLAISYFADSVNYAFSLVLYLYYYILNSLSLFWLAESVQWIFEISACDVISADYTVIMSGTLKVTGNHVKFARFVLLAVSEEAKTWLPFFSFSVE